MKRKDKEVKDMASIESIIKKAQVCRLGMCLNDAPYVVPLNFGYKSNTFYFHSANEGKKIDILKANPKVCFEIDTHHVLVEGEKACNYTMTFESVIGYGTVRIITKNEEKLEGLNTLMRQYTDKSGFEYSDKALSAVTILALEIEEINGKSSYLK